MLSSIQGTIHQGHESFNALSRGRQCPFMVLSALLHSQSWPVHEWTQKALDELLHFADSMYLHALKKGDIPDTATLLISHLPTIATSLDGGNWTINYGECIEGFINPLADTIIPNFQTLSSALISIFQATNSAILVLDGYMTALIKDTDHYALFDSHARSAQGMPCTEGFATICTFSTLAAVQQHIQSLSTSLSSNRFELVPLKCIERNDTMSKEEKKQRANRKQYLKRKLCESDIAKKERLSKAAKYKKDNQNKFAYDKKQWYKRSNHSIRNTESNKATFLTEFNVEKNGPLHDQVWAKENMKKFHDSMKYSIVKCIVCFEAWPLRSVPRILSSYICRKCKLDKKLPKKFSNGNNMIPSSQPAELLGLTQVEEMLIARALPIMRVYIKPGGQRAYSGHCINLPQDVKELADFLPRYPKDIPIIVVKMKGRNDTFKDVTVRKQQVENALNWLIRNNPQYKNVTLNQDALDSLPQNNVPEDLITVHLTEEMNENDLDINTELLGPDLGPNTNAEDIVYDEESDISSFLPVASSQQQEIEAAQEQLSQTMDWPSLGNDPLSEFTTPFLASMAFPVLFPDGKGDPTNPQTMRDVSFADKIKHLIKIGNKTDNGWSYPFANHPRFSYWALNMIQRQRTLQQGAIFLKQNPGEAHLTADELRQLINDNNYSSLVSKISRYVANVSGTNSYWHRVKEDLKAIIHHEGPPTFFFTLSAADMHWPDLHCLFGNSNNSQVRRQNIINNPHIADWFFTERVEGFVKHWLYNSLDAKWHWFRYEYQGRRGSIHLHGTAKLKNDPGLCELTETALQGFLAEHESVLDGNVNTDTLLTIEKGKLASKTVCQYVDWLLSTSNPLPPDDNIWIKPDIHPCQERYQDLITEAQFHNDYVDLLNTVQRHTRCSTAYCLKKSNSDGELKCRFKYPFQHSQETTLQFEPISSKDNNTKYRAKLVTKRNDSRLNSHQRLQLQGWRANCDIQIIIDYHACIEYMAKYASKGEPKSPILKHTLKSVLTNNTGVTESSRLIKKLMMKALGERDFSAQETMHHLLSLKLYSSTFKVFNVSLNGSRKVKHVNNEEDGVATENSILDIYATRQQFSDVFPDIMNVNFVDFVTKFRVVNKKLKKHINANEIPRFFPTYSSNPKADSFPLYCKYQLLRYKPWKNAEHDAWGNQNATNELYTSNWEEFLRTEYAQNHVPNWLQKFQAIQALNEGQCTENDSTPCSLEVNTTEREEWMILSDLHEPFSNHNSSNISDNDEYWQMCHEKYTAEQIDEMPTWIDNCKKDFDSNNNHNNLPHIDTDTFSSMQYKAYNIIQNHSENRNGSAAQLLLIVVGVGGTGKSFLINCIRSLLGNSCAVTATTGKAAYNIKGVAIHSLLKLPIGSKGRTELTGQTLICLQADLTDIRYIIIDEYSMLGQCNLGWIDRRCRQATALKDQPFGGLSVILIGDQGQLPPVGDKPLYHSRASSELGQQGYLLYHMFDKVVELTHNFRAQGETSQQVEFRELLMRLRTGESTENDWKLLLTRQPSAVENISDFENATRLFFHNEQVAHYNFNKLAQLQQPIARINGRHSTPYAAKLPADDMMSLEPSIFLCKDAHIMLTINLWTTTGLCNGATGKVIDIIYKDKMQPPDLPVAVLVQFDGYTGPLYLPQLYENCVPISPFTATLDIAGTRHERQQLPIRLSWAITIHKSQGLTLELAWIDIGKSERVSGITYVAISRVRKLADCIIEPMTFERLSSIKNSRNYQFRLEEECRLHLLACTT